MRIKITEIEEGSQVPNTNKFACYNKSSKQGFIYFPADDLLEYMTCFFEASQLKEIKIPGHVVCGRQGDKRTVIIISRTSLRKMKKMCEFVSYPLFSIKKRSMSVKKDGKYWMYCINNSWHSIVPTGKQVIFTDARGYSDEEVREICVVKDGEPQLVWGEYQ